MKRLLSTVLTLFLCLSVCVNVSCAKNITYESSVIYVRYVNDNEHPIMLSEEERDNMLRIWNNAEWEEDITKSAADYLFELDGITLYYTSHAGIFDDRENYRHFYLHKSEWTQIDSMLNSKSND